MWYCTQKVMLLAHHPRMLFKEIVLYMEEKTLKNWPY